MSVFKHVTLYILTQLLHYVITPVKIAKNAQNPRILFADIQTLNRVEETCNIYTIGFIIM